MSYISDNRNSNKGKYANILGFVDLCLGIEKLLCIHIFFLYLSYLLLKKVLEYSNVQMTVNDLDKITYFVTLFKEIRRRNI